MFTTSMETVATIILMMVIGAILRRIGVLNDDGGKLLRDIITKVGTPALTIYNLLSLFPRELLHSAGLMILAPMGVMLLSFGLGWLLAKAFKLRRGRRAVFANMCALSNGIYMGLPVCQGLFGDVSLPFVMVFFFANTLTFWTVASAALTADPMEGAQGRFSFKRLFKGFFNVPQITFLLCMLLLALDVRLPDFIMTTAKHLGATTSPLALLFIGMVLYKTGFKGMKPDASLWLMLAFRFVIVPLSTLFACVALGIEAFPTLVISVLAGMPAMVLTVIMSDHAGADTKYAAAGVSISTLLSLVLIPVYMLALPPLIAALQG